MSQAGLVNVEGGGTTVVETLTGNTGGPVSPTGNNINTVGTGSITIAGNAGTSTLTTQLTGLTQYSVLIGAGTPTITNVAPSATSGVPLISQGAAANPAFGTAVVAGGGTGVTSFTAYSVICGGTTSTGALQNVSGLGTSGQVLTSNGAGALPTWQTNTTFGWSDQSGSFTAAVYNGYFITGTSTATLPASPAEGDTISFVVDTTNILTITAAGSQLIRVGNVVSAAGGTCASQLRGDSITLVYRASGTTWFSLTGPQGTWVLT